MLNFDDSENFLREHGDYFTTHYYDSAVSPCGSLSSGSAISTIVSGSTESGLNSLATEADACHSAPCSPQKQMTQAMTSAKRASLPNLTSQGGATEGTDVNSESTVIGLCSLNESNHRAEKNMGEKWCKGELKGVAESSFTSGVKKDVKERLLSQKTPSRDQSAVLARLGGVATPSDKVWCQTGPCLVADISKPSELVLSVRNHFADRIPNTSLARLPSGEGKNVDQSSKSNVFTKCSRKHDNREKSTEIVTISQTVNGYGNKEAHSNSHSYANSVQCEHKTKTKPPEYHRNKDMNCDDAKRHRASHSPAAGDSVLKACCDKGEGSSRAGQAIKPDETHTTAVSLGILKSRGQRGLKEISWQSDQTSYETSPPLLQPSMPPCHSYPLQFPPRGVHPVPDYGTLTPSSGLQDNVTRDLSTRQRDNTPGRRLGVLAPPLNDNVQYHAYFLFHQHNRDWVLGLIDKLESPRLGFRCCCHERDFPSSLTLQQSVLFGMKNALKTVIIISDTFLAASWHHIEAIITGGADITCLQRDVIAIMVEKCEVPTSLSELPYLTTHTGAAWWTKLLARLALPDELTISEEALLAISPSFIGIHPELHSTLLLVSMKSRCSCCGKEVIDTTEVPEELVQNGIQIAEEEYREVMCQLMHDLKFRCHIWCYNMPLAITFFTILLGLCLILIPLVETHYFFNGPETGLEFVHGGVVWLCVLTIYMIITHLSRRKMKENTYQSLANVNTQLVKYNILLGVENLGLADCNKYYLHFFYYELEPCLGYMMELLMSLEECSQCYHNNTTTNDVTIDVEYDDVMHQSVSERITVLENANITNASIQIRAEELLLDHSGEFISMLITKKLDRPSKQRHVKGCYCLCQFVEQRLYKCPV